MKRKRALSILGILIIAIVIRVFYLLLEVEVDETFRDYYTLHERMGDWGIEKFFGCEEGAFTTALGGIISFFAGPSLLNTRVASLVLFSLFIFSVYFLGRQACNSNVGLLSMLFVAMGTPFFILWNVAGESGVMDVLLLGNILLIFGAHLRKSGRGSSGLFFFAGIIAGLGFLAGRMLICYYVIGTILLLRSKFFSKGNLFPYLFGFVLASSPFWIYHFPGYGSVRGLHRYEVNLSNLHAIPRVFGFIPFEGLYSYPILLIYVSCFLYYTWLMLRKSGGEFVYDVKQLFFLLLIILTVNCISGESSWKILPLFSVFPILLSYAVLRMPRVFSSLLIFFILVGNGRGLVLAYQFRQVPQSVKVNKQEYGLGELVSFLRGKEIKAVYAIASVGFRLMSETGREIICSEPWLGMSPRYTQVVDASDEFAYVLKGRRDTEKFATSLSLAGGKYEMEEVHPGLTVFYSFSPPQQGTEIARSGWSATSDCNEGAVSNAFDGVTSTRWTTQKPQRPGMFFLLDMGRVERVNRVSLLCSGDRDCPKYFTLFTSVDGDEWSEIISTDSRYFPGLHWSGSHLFWEKRTGNLDVHFQAVNARYVKIVLKGLSRHFYWSINEMSVYCPVERVHDLSEREIVKLGERLIKNGVKRVYAPEWLMAKLASFSDGKLKTLWRYNRENVYNEFPRNVDFGDATAFLLDGAKTSVLKDFWRVAKLGEMSGYHIYSVSGRLRELMPLRWEAGSNCRPEEVSFAFDRDWLTRWSSGKSQEPGIYYQLDLGGAQNVAEVVLSFAGSPHDYPRGFRLLTSVDGTDWKEMKTRMGFRFDYFWTGEHLLKVSGEPGEVQISFEPIPARFVKIVLTEGDPAYYWSIHEIHVYTNGFL